MALGFKAVSINICLPLPPCSRPEPGRAYRAVFPSKIGLPAFAEGPAIKLLAAIQSKKISEMYCRE